MNKNSKLSQRVFWKESNLCKQFLQKTLLKVIQRPSESKIQNRVSVWQFYLMVFTETARDIFLRQRGSKVLNLLVSETLVTISVMYKKAYVKSGSRRFLRGGRNID